MKFRPCIDIHNGKVKQIVGGSLRDSSNLADDNYVSENGAEYYALLYQKYNLKGGHIIMLNPVNSEYYGENLRQTVSALGAYPGGLQAGGGVTADNASYYIDAGASHVIVTSYVFKDGNINYDNLKKICGIVGKEKLVIDLSCRKYKDDYYVVTDRWQKFTKERLSEELIYGLSEYCDEFLIHGVDAEGKINGMEKGIVRLLGNIDGNIKFTYAGGISSYGDIDELAALSGKNSKNIDYTVGSALDIFGGNLEFEKLASYT